MKSLKPIETGVAGFTALLASLALAVAASAQTVDANDVVEEKIPDAIDMEAPEVSRDADELPGDIEPAPDHPVRADTVISFTNLAGHRNLVSCAGISKNGERMGATLTVLPPKGVRYVRFSDLTDRRPAVGHVVCRSTTRADAVAVFLGPGLTDLPVRKRRGKETITYRIPLAATY